MTTTTIVETTDLSDRDVWTKHVRAYANTPLTKKRIAQIDKMTDRGLARIISNPKTYKELNYAFATAFLRQQERERNEDLQTKERHGILENSR